MATYSCTDLGRRVIKSGGQLPPEEVEALQYVRDHKSVPDGELESQFPHWAIRGILRHGYIKDLEGGH